MDGMGFQLMALGAEVGPWAVPRAQGSAVRVTAVQPWVRVALFSRWLRSPISNVCSTGWETPVAPFSPGPAPLLQWFLFSLTANSGIAYHPVALIIADSIGRLDHKDVVWFTMLNARPHGQIYPFWLADGGPVYTALFWALAFCGLILYCTYGRL